MNDRTPHPGKVSAEVFEKIVFPNLGARREEVLVAPQHGVDVGVVDIGGGRVLAITSDPVFIVPEYGWERAAWFAVHILASDAATSGLTPTFMTVDLNLPLSMSTAELEKVWKAFSSEAGKLGIAIVAGHTGRYAGCGYPMVGGATVMSVGRKEEYVTPRGARPGDKVVVTKGPAIEAAGLFAVTFPSRVADAYGEDFARRAEGLFYRMSVVEDCRLAAAVGVGDEGVTAMHDATECGLWGGLCEVADASEIAITVRREDVPLPEEVEKVCSLFGIDPFSSISEGTLVAAVRPEKAEAVVSRLEEGGISASIVGEVSAGRGVSLVEGGGTRKLENPEVDPFWAAFERELSLASG